MDLRDKAPLAILITYFNEKELLTECLHSLFDSNEVIPSEVIIYDDYSKADCEPQLYVPVNLPIQVKIIRGNENKGPGYGRTELLQHTKLEYIHFHDADDLFAKNWCSAIYEQIRLHGPDVIVTGVKSMRNDQVLSEDIMAVSRQKEPIDLVKWGLSGAILPASTTFKRELAIRIGGYEPRAVLEQSEDFHFHIKLGLLKPITLKIEKALVIQRLRPNSNSHSAGLLVCHQSGLKALNLLADELIKAYKPDLAESYSRIGYSLYVLGDINNARVAFKKAKELGLKKFPGRSKYFVILARIFGQELAEQISLMIQQYKKSK